MHNREDGLKRTLKGKVYAYSNLGPCFNVLLALPLVADTIYISLHNCYLPLTQTTTLLAGRRARHFFG